jgi:hypothetical protein
MLVKTAKLAYFFTTVTKCRGFIAISDPTVRAEVLSNANPKLEALVNVLSSLSNAEAEYLNLLLAEKSLSRN